MMSLYRSVKTFFYIRTKSVRRFLNSRKPQYKTRGSFWIQELPCQTINDRMDLFIPICEDKKIIHFGCTDWPIFNPNNNLHVKLSKISKSIDGFDIDKPGIEKLKAFVPQEYYSDFKGLEDKAYDVCLVPETIEHVDNVAEFLRNVSKLNSKVFLITAPNILANWKIKTFKKTKYSFKEVVHPDHNAWYSPYTLKNVIEKYTSLKVRMTYLMQDDTMVCCECIKQGENEN